MNETNTKTLPEGWRWVRLGEVCEMETKQRMFAACVEIGRAHV
jgi:hypothetical protein